MMSETKDTIILNGFKINFAKVAEVTPIYEIGGGYFEFAVRFKTGLATGECGKDVSSICLKRDSVVGSWQSWKRGNK